MPQTWGSQKSQTRRSRRSRSRILPFRIWDLVSRFRAKDIPRLWLRLLNHWAWQRLIRDPTIILKFPCLDDYGNSGISKEWIKLSRPTLILVHRWPSMLDQIEGLVEKINFNLVKGEKILNFKILLAGKFLNFCRLNFSRRLGCLRPCQSFNELIKWSRFGQLSILEWSSERLSSVSHNDSSSVEFKAFLGFQDTSIHYCLLFFRPPTPRLPS